MTTKCKYVASYGKVSQAKKHAKALKRAGYRVRIKKSKHAAEVLSCGKRKRGR